MNKYTSKLKRAEFEAGNSSIFKVSMEIKNLTCNEIQNIQRQLDSKLYQLIDYYPLIKEFDNKLQVSNSHIKMPFYTHKNSEFWNSLIMKKKNKRWSIRQIQYLNWLFNENRDWTDQLWYLFNISASNYYRIKKFKFDQNQLRNDWKDDNEFALRTMLLLQDILKPLSYRQQLKQLQLKLFQFNWNII